MPGKCPGGSTALRSCKTDEKDQLQSERPQAWQVEVEAGQKTCAKLC